MRRLAALIWLAALIICAIVLISVFATAPQHQQLTSAPQSQKPLLQEPAPQEIFAVCTRASAIVATAAIGRSQGKSERQALDEASWDNEHAGWKNAPALVSSLVHWVYQHPLTEREAGDYIDSCLTNYGYDPAVTLRKSTAGGYSDTLSG
jgi:hypothetical protein